MYGKRSPCDPQHVMTTTRFGIVGGVSPADDEVHDAAAHVDRALHGLAREVLADVLVALRNLDDLGLLRFGRDRDLAAHLAVHLHRNLEHVGFEKGRIRDGPGVVRERLLVPEPLPQLLGEMRRERRQQQHERLGRGARHLRPFVRGVRQLHQRGDRRVEAHRLDVLGDLRDRLVHEALLLARRLGVGHAGALPPSSASLPAIKPPDPVQEPVRALDAARVPRLHLLERPHEHLVEPERVGAVARDDLVGIHDVAAALAHLVGARLDRDLGVVAQHEPVALLLDELLGHPLAVHRELELAEDHSLVHELLERLGRRHDAGVEQDLVPEACVEQMQHRVLAAADVEVDRQPVLLELGSTSCVGFVGSMKRR